MNIYSLIRLYQRIRSPRLRMAGLLLLHVLRRRYLNMVFDPALGCNLRCRMCYFSDPEVRKAQHGTFSQADIDAIAHALFHRVLRLQIGCGAEPTIYARLPELVAKARKHGIPHISLTTNGQLIDREKLDELVASGLTEIIISAHGLSAAIYEEMMPGASFDRFLTLIDLLGEAKAAHPALRVRLNYTMNQDNIADLRLLPEVFSRLHPDTIQLRPIQKIGETAYNEFSMERLISQYDECIAPVVAFCKANDITCIYPERDNLAAITADEEDAGHDTPALAMLPYFHLSPYEGWKEKIDPYRETFEDYSRRTHRTRLMLSCLLGRPDAQGQDSVTRMLNYNIQ